KDKRVQVHPSIAHVSVQTKLTSFAKLSKRDDVTMAAFPEPADGATYFRAAFAPPGDLGRVVALVQISPDYPTVRPRFVLQHDLASTVVPTTNQLKVRELSYTDMAAEVNEFASDLIPVGDCASYDVLIHQVRTLQVLTCPSPMI
ncbi:hypothetical protein AaE_011790, partial [Aphanomyces astaci]